MEALTYAFTSWLIYAVLGLISALLQGEKFDPKKMGKSIVWLLLVAYLMHITGLPPQRVLALYESFIEQSLVFIMNSGAGLTLIWCLDRIYWLLRGLAEKLPL